MKKILITDIYDIDDLNVLVPFLHNLREGDIEDDWPGVAEAKSEIREFRKTYDIEFSDLDNDADEEDEEDEKELAINLLRARASTFFDEETTFDFTLNVEIF